MTSQREQLEIALREILDDDDAVSVVQIALAKGWQPPALDAEMAQRVKSAADRMTQRTFLPHVALLCDGDEPHYALMPRVYTDGPTGEVECGECGASMCVVDIITVERKASWSSLHYLARGRRYFGV